VQTKVANLSDRSVRYLEGGAGRPLIWLHAFPLSAEHWLPELHRVPPGWRVIAPDLRGFRGVGPSFEHVGLDSASMATHAADVLELMSHLEADRPVVGGMSMGGYIAFALMRKAASRIAGLILADTRATADSPETIAARDRMIAIAQRDGVAGVAREMVPALLGTTTHREQPDLDEVLTRLITANSTDGVIAGLLAIRQRPDSTDLLPGIACPTLVLRGEEDAIITAADAREMARAIPGAELVTIPGAGHLPNLEAPLLFSKAVREFLATIPPV